jgi:hypothetical protein
MEFFLICYLHASPPFPPPLGLPGGPTSWMFVCVCEWVWRGPLCARLLTLLPACLLFGLGTRQY